MTKLLPVSVQFAGVELEGIVRDGKAFVALRPIVEGMGLDWKSQFDKIKSDEVLGSTVVEITTVAADGKRRPMLCLPEEFLQGWLFKLNPRKVRADLREKVTHYQRECYAVLHQAFTRGVGETNLRILAVDSKRAMGRLMTDVTKDVLILAGKEPKPYHFSNEHRLVNWALVGEFTSVDEKSLSYSDVVLLADLRRKNALLIARGVEYGERKVILERHATLCRAANSPIGLETGT